MRVIGQEGCANTGGQRFRLPAGPEIKGPGTPGGGAEAHRSVLQAPSHRPRKMRLAVRALLACAVLGLCLAVSPEKTVRWCTVSNHEASKCSSFMENMKTVLENGPFVSCVKRTSYLECIKAIWANEADAVTLDAGLVFEAGLNPYNLKPVVAEFYGKDKQTRYYAVAVVKKSSTFNLNQLQGKKSCHTGLGRSAGWNIPMGLLYWKLPEPRESLQKAASSFFTASCVPCVDRTAFPKLCQLCVGKGTDKCACSNHEPYFGYSGAFKCLMEDAGEVAFVKHSTVLENLPNKADLDQYELLCPDNKRKPVGEYKQCYLAKVPSHAVVARSVGGKEDLIWELLNQAQEHYGKDKSKVFQLFSSTLGKDLLFKDSAEGFFRIPPKMDTWLYLGYEYVTALRNLREDVRPDTPRDECKKVKWCAVGHHEIAKCDEWSVNSEGKIECESAESTEDCIAKIAKGEADAMSLDGGYIYIAGQCGLVPVLAENYKTQGSTCSNTAEEGYLAVAVVKELDKTISWNNLQGRKSCHTAVDRTAGWNIPMGLLYNRINHCEFDKFFSQGCAPGSMRNSSLCALCIGSANVPGKECVPNNHERYYGYTGAFRCLVEKGDVAFVKDQTVLQNTGGKNTEDWAKDLKEEDFELLCPDGQRKSVDKAPECFLAKAPNHAVVSRKDKASCVSKMLLDQQLLFGRNGNDCSGKFCLFHSATKDLLFRDDTQCLAKLPEDTTYKSYLGAEYITAVANLRQCSTSKLLEACTFHTS
uniref:Serotransferrin n=2 Tax=Canis lupus familiaris TaxID=9615 RepID=A0A8I3Q3K3_CANLF